MEGPPRAGALVLKREVERLVLAQTTDKKALGQLKLLEGESYHKNGARLFTEVPSGIMTVNGHKL